MPMKSMDKPGLQGLEAKLDELIQRCQIISDENRMLREEQAVLLKDRQSLREKTALARSRIEAMIVRLKAMEAEEEEESE